MPIFAIPAVLAGTIAAGGAVAAGAIGAHAAGSAANAQAGAAKTAAQLQAEQADKALAFQKQQWQTQQQQQAPWLQAGQGAIGQLSRLTSTPGQGLLTPFSEQFNAPTSVTEQNDPGYQFRLQQGQQALQNSAAARGGLLSGNTAQALNDYTQNYASNEYGNVYNRALGEYQQRYNIFQQNQANQYNRLAGISGAGQQTAGQLGQLGQQASGNVSNILLGSGQQIGNAIQNAGAARASGYVGGANAWGGALSGLGNMASSLYLANQLNKGVNPYTGGLDTVPSASASIYDDLLTRPAAGTVIR